VVYIQVGECIQSGNCSVCSVVPVGCSPRDGQSIFLCSCCSVVFWPERPESSESTLLASRESRDLGGSLIAPQLRSPPAALSCCSPTLWRLRRNTIPPFRSFGPKDSVTCISSWYVSFASFRACRSSCPRFPLRNVVTRSPVAVDTRCLPLAALVVLLMRSVSLVWIRDTVSVACRGIENVTWWFPNATVCPLCSFSALADFCRGEDRCGSGEGGRPAGTSS
jgi:hypothetical protein